MYISVVMLMDFTVMMQFIDKVKIICLNDVVTLNALVSSCFSHFNAHHFHLRRPIFTTNVFNVCKTQTRPSGFKFHTSVSRFSNDHGKIRFVMGCRRTDHPQVGIGSARQPSRFK